MGWQNISIPSRVVRGVKFTYILSTRVKTLSKLWFPWIVLFLLDSTNTIVDFEERR
jgi:hypothetical protein